MSVQNAKVSVVIAVKNDARRLRVLLDSIAGLPERPQVIVVDNGSTDDSVSVARQCGAEVFSHPKLRVGALRNRGVEHADGDVLAFADSDHEVPVDWLQRGLLALEAQPGVVAAGSHYLAPSDGTWVQRVWAIHRLRGADHRQVEWLGAGNLFVRRDAFEKVGGFSETLVAAEDVDLCHRLREQGGRIVCDHSIRSVHHGEPKTVWHFLKKEYWRGSSGVRAWVAQGFPMRDLPSLVWPVWHLAFGLLGLCCFLASAFWLDRAWFAYGVLAWGGWLAPSGILAIKTAWETGYAKSVAPLWCLYFFYGIARAAALFRK
ncbi:MAG: glycosyltransferase [Pirellula sp.]